MSTTPTPTAPLPVAEIERRLRWRVLPTVMFVTLLSALAVGGYSSLTMPHQHPTGLPDDPRAQQAFALLAGRVSATTNALRWRSTLLGGEPVNAAPSAAMLARAGTARARIEALTRSHWTDPRPLAALAALDLVAHDYPHAAGRYRRACELAPHYGEARLGAGVALALEADRTAEAWQSRALRLQALAQFAMVDSVDAEYLPALYDRALTLTDVGRNAEARFVAGQYLAREGSGARAEALRRLGAER